MSSSVMLVSGRLKDQTIVAVVNKKNNALDNLNILSKHETECVNNIYNGSVKALVRSLNSVFVSYDENKRDAFLSTSRIDPSCLKANEKKEAGKQTKKSSSEEGIFYDDDDESATSFDSSKQQNETILSSLKVGEKLLVQVIKDERGTKGATLSTYIKIAGTYLVIMPNNPKSLGISRHVTEEQRQQIKEIAKKLKIPTNMGIIIRTAGTKQTVAELQAELDRLIARWEAIQEASKAHKAPCLIYEEQDILIRTVRDCLRRECESIVVDDEASYEKIKAYFEQENKAYLDKLSLYSDQQPLFDQYPIQKQIDIIYERRVPMSSGAELVIDPTEALTSIDVNSAKATKGESIHETALTINLEAAKEIAKQIRHRNLSGLIVIDFIDMIEATDREQVEKTLTEALSEDRARVQVLPISSLGLLTLSRQGIGSSIFNQTFSECPRCHSTGRIRHIENLAISILRNIEENANHEQITLVQAYLPVPVASFLLNEQHVEIRAIESRQSVKVHVIPDMNLETPEFKIKRFRTSQPQPSYEHTPEKKTHAVDDMRDHFPGNSKKKTALVSDKPSSTQEKKSKAKKGLIQSIMKKIFTEDEKNTKTSDGRQDGRAQDNRRGGTRTRSTRHNRRRPSSERNRTTHGTTTDRGHTRRPTTSQNKRDDGQGSRNNERGTTERRHTRRSTTSQNKRDDGQTQTARDNEHRSTTRRSPQNRGARQTNPNRAVTEKQPREENFNRISNRTEHDD